MCPDVSSTTFDSPWRDPRYRRTWPRARSRVAAAWSLLFFADVTCVGCCLLLPLRPQKKVDIVLRVPQLRQWPAYPRQNPKERNCKPKLAVSHERLRSEDHGVCPRARLLQAVLARAALATCKLLSSHEKPAPSLLSSSLFSLSTLFPPSLSSPFSPPKALVQVVQDEETWEGARPTSRVPVRNEGTGARRLSNFSCLAFPAADCLMAISA